MKFLDIPFEPFANGLYYYRRVSVTHSYTYYYSAWNPYTNLRITRFDYGNFSRRTRWLKLPPAYLTYMMLKYP